MRQRAIIGAGLALAMLAAAVSAAEALNTLTVQVENVGRGGGWLRVEVFDRGAYEGGAVNPTYAKKEKAHAGTMRVIFVGVDPGAYVVRAIQDVNANAVRDKGLFGKMSEPVGYSGVTPLRSRPSFRESKFTVYPGDNKVVVRLRR